MLRDLAAAEAALAQKRAEDAALAIQSAVRRVGDVVDEGLRAELLPRVIALRDKADPVAKTADDASREAAAALVAVAQAYEQRGWLRSARDLLLRASSIAPAVAAAPLARVRERLASAGGAAPEGLQAWFGAGEAIHGAPDWIVAADGLTTVAPTASVRATRYLGGVRVRSERLRFACRVPADSAYGIGLIFAWRHAADFHVATVRPRNGRWHANLAHANVGSYTTLAEGWLPAEATAPNAETAKPMELVVTVDGTAVRFTAAGLELKVALPAPLRPGFLGVQTEHTGADGPPVKLTAIAIDAEVQR